MVRRFDVTVLVLQTRQGGGDTVSKETTIDQIALNDNLLSLDAWFVLLNGNKLAKQSALSKMSRWCAKSKK